MSDERSQRLRRKNLVVGALLAGCVLLFYLITVVKITGGGG
ncbi:MAG: hypothetical protein ACFB6S_07560 [Geminicoccaceae bacterium]